MDPLSRLANASSASDLAGLLSAAGDASDYASCSEANSSFAFRTPEPPADRPAADGPGAVATTGEGLSDDAFLRQKLVAQLPSATDSLYSRSEAGTSVVSDGDFPAGQDAALQLSECLRRVLLGAGHDPESAACAVLAASDGDCCVYANCNCRLSLKLPPAAAAAADPALKMAQANGDPALQEGGVVGDGRSTKRSAVAVVAGCHCCCIS